MAGLSISRAWDETKARIAADGKLIGVVALALIALPALVSGVVSPQAYREDSSVTVGLVVLVTSLIAVIGQLAIIRLAIGPAVSVGEAIAHGARRMPIYVVSGILILIGCFLVAIPFAMLLVAAGVPMEEAAIVRSPIAALALLVFLAIAFFFAIRLLMTSPVASEEDVGPIAIIRRSWTLTAGHWWRLFGFIIIFLIGALIVMTAVNWAIGSVAVTLLGAIEPMSASALLIAVVDAFVNAGVTLLLGVMLARIYVQLSGQSLDVTVPRTGI